MLFFVIIAAIVTAAAIAANAIQGPDSGYTCENYRDQICGRGDF